MRHQKQGRKLNRTASHRKALMMNMASSLVLHKRIRTTDAKAKELRSFIERLITYAKKGDIHNRRLIQQKLKRSEKLKKIEMAKLALIWLRRLKNILYIMKRDWVLLEWVQAIKV